MIVASILVVVTLAVASLPPAWRASRLKVVEALANV
jgi:ABC-type lipoprotein release transport system permease subunit